MRTSRLSCFVSKNICLQGSQSQMPDNDSRAEPSAKEWMIIVILIYLMGLLILQPTQ